MGDDRQLRYDLRHVTHGGRCAWCWQALSETDSHVAVLGRGVPLELHFHHRCWPSYHGLSGIEGREARALYREWSPQRVEALRLHAGLSLGKLAEQLKVSKERLVGYLGGGAGLGQKPVARLRNLAVDSRFERAEEIDWSDRRACFCLCMNCGWNAGDLGKRLGVQDNTVTTWWDRGVPLQSLRHRTRLTALAKQHGFDSGMLLDDRLCTKELAREMVEKSGLTQVQLAAAAGCEPSLVRDAVQGKRRINRLRVLKQVGLRGVVSFSDPVPRRTADGQLVCPGHVGTIYQAGNAAYLGRGSPTPLFLLPDGTTFSKRAISKVRNGEQGREYACRQLMDFGADDPRETVGWVYETYADWLSYWLPLLTRRVRHPGNHRYAWALAGPRVESRAPSPKQIDRYILAPSW